MRSEVLPASQRAELLWPQTSQSKIFFLNLAPGPLESWTLALGGWERCRPTYALERSHYAYHVIEFIVAGSGEARLDGRCSALEPGTILSYAPQTRCSLHSSAARPMGKYFFAVAGSAVAARLLAWGLPPGTVRRAAQWRALLPLAELIVREGRASGRRAVPVCMALLEALLLKVAEEQTQAGADGLAWCNFQRCKAILEETPWDADLSLRDMARRARLDSSTICRLFRRFEGVSPRRFWLVRRMHRAAELLWASPLLVKEVARRCGFTDPFHFARCFRKVHGVPPTTLRAQARGSNAAD